MFKILIEVRIVPFNICIIGGVILEAMPLFLHILYKTVERKEAMAEHPSTFVLVLAAIPSGEDVIFVRRSSGVKTTQLSQLDVNFEPQAPVVLP